MSHSTDRASAQASDVRLRRNVLISLVDGISLAADLYLPASPRAGGHPTLVSFYPYRKDDVIGSFAAYPCRWFAQRGYAHLLVDVRGYGSSEGGHAESFDPRTEHTDAHEVVEWAAEQEWSNGSVGVWGISYGGFMALAAGVARPPHLQAIAPIYPLWDPYEDVAAPGGCPTMITQHQWSTIMLAQRLAPPTFRDNDGRWLRVWHDRLRQVEREGVDISRWREHPDRDAYWQERVLPLEKIEVPTFLIGGWRDLFPHSVARAFELIPSSKRLLFGPWLHVQPDLAALEPVDWLQLLLGFWDTHVCHTAPAEEPSVLVYVQGAGGWRRDTTWPPRTRQEQTLYPRSGGFLSSEQGPGTDEYAATPLVGVTGGQWDAMATGMGDPLDQTADDLLALTYTSGPLQAPLEIVGSPQAVLAVERLDDSEPFELAVRLVDVAPNGHAELVTEGSARCEGMTAVTLRTTAWAFSAGHSLRLAVSCADFPRLWPNRSNPTILLHHPQSELRLPIVPDGFGEHYEPPRPTPIATTERFPWSVHADARWTIERDLARDATAVTLGGSELIRLPDGGTLALRQDATARVAVGHPEGASVEAVATIEITFPDGERVEVDARSRIWRDRDLYEGHVTSGGLTIFQRTWESH